MKRHVQYNEQTNLTMLHVVSPQAHVEVKQGPASRHGKENNLKRKK